MCDCLVPVDSASHGYPHAVDKALQFVEWLAIERKIEDLYTTPLMDQIELRVYPLRSQVVFGLLLLIDIGFQTESMHLMYACAVMV